VTRRRLAVWLVIALVFVDLLFLSGASNFLAAPQSRLLNQVIVLVMMLGFLVAASRGQVPVRSPLILPGIAWLAATAVTTLLSERPATSLESLALLLLAAPAYLVVRAILWEDRLRERIDTLIVLATGVFVAAYLAQALTQWISWWSVAGPSIPPLRPGDVGLTVGTVNAVAIYLLLLAPTATATAWAGWKRPSIALALGGLSLLALVVTGSRGAWLGAVAGLVATVVMWIAVQRPTASRPSRRGWLGIVLATVAVGVVAVALAPALTERLLSGDAGRIELWTAAWQMFLADPISGVGPGTFPDVRPTTAISGANLAVLTTSHNSVLHVLAEMGVLGLIAGTWLLLAVGRLAYGALRGLRAQARDDRSLVIAAIASLVAAGVHSIVDTQFHLPAVVLLVFLAVARLDPPDRDVADGRPGRRTWRVIAITGVAVVTGALLLVPIDIAMIRGAFGNQALDRGDARSALVDYQAAAGMH
jgi:O-antigen ligase